MELRLLERRKVPSRTDSGETGTLRSGCELKELCDAALEGGGGSKAFISGGEGVDGADGKKTETIETLLFEPGTKDEDAIAPAVKDCNQN